MSPLCFTSTLPSLHTGSIASHAWKGAALGNQPHFGFHVVPIKPASYRVWLLWNVGIWVEVVSWSLMKEVFEFVT